MPSTLFERTPQIISDDAWIYPSRGRLQLINWITDSAGKRIPTHLNIRAKWMRRLLFRLAMEVGKQKARSARRRERRRATSARGKGMERT